MLFKFVEKPKITQENESFSHSPKFLPDTTDYELRIIAGVG